MKWVWDVVQNRVDQNQYGSNKKSATTHSLVDLLHQCYTCTSKQYARILLFDFSKVFDLINHYIFLQKRASFGLPNILLKWIASFLTERTSQSKLCNTESDWNHTHGGVPQGIKLGHLRFVLTTQSANSINMLHRLHWIILTTPTLQDEADAAYLWTLQNDTKINKSKTRELDRSGLLWNTHVQ